MPSPTNLNLYRVGQLVTLKASVLGEPAGTMAYAYENYMIGREPGVSLITINGVDLGGFSFEEQRDYLQHLCDTTFRYEFVSVMHLADDFRRGTFNRAFNIGLQYQETRKAQEGGLKQPSPKVHQMQKIGGVWQLPGDEFVRRPAERSSQPTKTGADHMSDALELLLQTAFGLPAEPSDHTGKLRKELQALGQTMGRHVAGKQNGQRFEYYEPLDADGRFGPDAKIYYDHSDRMWYVHDPTANDRYYELHGHWPPTDMRTRSFDPMG